MTRRHSYLIAASLFAMALQGCSLLGDAGGGRRGGGERGPGREGSELRQIAPLRLSANDNIRLRLTDLRIALNLTPEQTGLWQAYEDKVAATLTDKMRDPGGPPAGNALNQIDRLVAAERRRALAMEQIFSAARNLYAALGEQQKTVADRLFSGTVPVE